MFTNAASPHFHNQLEVAPRPKRSISFSKDSPQVFEYSPLLFEEMSNEDSITPKFSQTISFSQVFHDLQDFSAHELKIHEDLHVLNESSQRLPSINKCKINTSTDQAEIDEFFCLTTDKTQGLSTSCGCISF
jgi:hypothetical protein